MSEPEDRESLRREWISARAVLLDRPVPATDVAAMVRAGDMMDAEIATLRQKVAELERPRRWSVGNSTYVDWIKAHRQQFGSGLAEAKHAVDDGWRPGADNIDWRFRAQTAEAALAQAREALAALVKVTERAAELGVDGLWCPFPELTVARSLLEAEG